MKKEDVKKEIEKIVKKHGAYPVILVKTENDGVLIGLLKSEYEHELRIYEFDDDFEKDSYGRPIKFTSIKSIRHLSLLNLVHIINGLKKIVEKNDFKIQVIHNRTTKKLKELLLL